MHVVTGGAYNGKAAWVKEFYQLETLQNVKWINAYTGEAFPSKLEKGNNVIVLEGVEQWVFAWMDQMDIDEIRSYGRQIIDQWKKWEQQDDEHQLVVIGTDISKGIVPLDRELRKWRDVTGWFYQDIVNQAKRVDFVWYGIAKRLK